MISFWNSRLDEIKERLQLKTELQLAVVLQMHPASLGHVRSGKSSPSAASALKILDKCGYVITRDLILRLLPEVIRAAIERADSTRAIKRGLLNSDQGQSLISDSTIRWVELVDRVKEEKGFTTDIQLAAFLGINTPSLSQVRRGSRGLTPVAKLNAFLGLGYPASEEVLMLILPEQIVTALKETSAEKIVVQPDGESDLNAGLDMGIPAILEP